MIRLICCVAVSLTLLLPAKAQPSVTLTDLSAREATSYKASVASQPAVSPHVLNTTRREGPVPAPPEGSVPARSVTFGERVGTIATTVFNVLAAQNAITLGVPENRDLDAYLRPPDARAGDGALFVRAKRLYDDVTRFETDRYDISVDPLSMRCEVKIQLSRLFADRPAVER